MMAKTVEILKFPSHWNGAVNCDPITFKDGGKACKAANCTTYPGGQGELLCVCHKFCQAHCRSPRTPNNIFTRDGVSDAKMIVAPYLNTSVADDWTLQVFNDCRSKLNGLDPERGVGLLHGLLLVGDDVELCKQLLELGVDPELRFVRSAKTKCELLDKATAEELSGGTALHFAACFGRKQCLIALIDAGANLDAGTYDNKTPGQLARDVVTHEILATASAKGLKHLAELAKEGKFFAIRFLMRAGRVSASDFMEKFEDRNAVDWIWAGMCSWNFSQTTTEEDLAVFKIMSEIKYRYGLEALKNAPPLITADKTTGAKQLEATLEMLKELKDLANDFKTAVKSLAEISRNIRHSTRMEHGLPLS